MVSSQDWLVFGDYRETLGTLTLGFSISVTAGKRGTSLAEGRRGLRISLSGPQQKNNRLCKVFGESLSMSRIGERSALVLVEYVEIQNIGYTV